MSRTAQHFVGWVERSDTHHYRSTSSMGIAPLNFARPDPSYRRPNARPETAV
ncbi:hypothetical protein [Pseudomonas paeninsulae]|uniref:hypothetical protein n=1 Tax=Pseudomonas paeninsulae TaxID=3110772 RepID=UPI002D768E9D|nr:hypothetical protein [Pseudomonas sp. IT1137]